MEFNSDDNATFLSSNGIAALLSQFVLYPTLLKYCSAKLILCIALVFNFIHVIAYAFLWNKRSIYLIVSCFSISMLGYPLLSALSSQHVPLAMQGRVQGAMGGLRNLTKGA